MNISVLKKIKICLFFFYYTDGREGCTVYGERS